MIGPSLEGIPMARKDISIANFNLLNLNLPGQPIYDDDG